MERISDGVANFFVILPALVVMVGYGVFDPVWGEVPWGKAAWSKALLHYYLIAKQWVTLYPAYVWSGFSVAYVLYVWGVRVVLRFWNERIRAWLLGIGKRKNHGDQFPLVGVDFEKYIALAARTNPGEYLIGRMPNGKLVAVTEAQRTMHTHVLGQTGSGKTQSVIYPLMMQDIRRGKAVVFLDAKGSSENLQAVISMAESAGRLADVKIFSLPYPESSHTFNPVYPYVWNPLATAQVLFSAFEIDHEYYAGQSRILFENLVVACAAIGKPYSLQDIGAAVTSPTARDELGWHLRQKEGAARDGLAAIRAVEDQFLRLGKQADMTFTGLDINLRQFNHPLLTSYNPDIRLQEDIESRKIIYFQLPSNMFKQLAPAIGRIVLQQLQICGSLRQVDRRSSDQSPVGIFIDEFYTFAYDGFIEALNKLRDAKFQFLLAHQDMSDLERISPEFARGIAGNTRLKIILAQQDFALAENVSKSLGTFRTQERTYKEEEGALWTRAATAGASSRTVEQFVLHPNSIKHLAEHGQAHVIWGAETKPVCLPLFVPPAVDFRQISLTRRRATIGMKLSVL